MYVLDCSHEVMFVAIDWDKYRLHLSFFIWNLFLNWNWFLFSKISRSVYVLITKDILLRCTHYTICAVRALYIVHVLCNCCCCVVRYLQKIQELRNMMEVSQKRSSLVFGNDARFSFSSIPGHKLVHAETIFPLALTQKQEKAACYILFVTLKHLSFPLTFWRRNWWPLLRFSTFSPSAFTWLSLEESFWRHFSISSQLCENPQFHLKI